MMGDKGIMKNKQQSCIVSFLAFVCFFCLIPDLSADDSNFFGSINLGTYSYLPDENNLEDRNSLIGRCLMGWQISPDSGWSVLTNFRFRSELENGTDAIDRLSVWDLRLDYGLLSKPIAMSAGLCTLTEVSGLGSVAGGQFQLNLFDQITWGVFGGANPVIEKGTPDFDGVKYGSYLRLSKGMITCAGIGYYKTEQTDEDYDSRDLIVFDTSLNYAKRLFLYQAGEYQIGSETNNEDALTYYFCNLRYQPVAPLAFSVYYNHYDQDPLLILVDDSYDDILDDYYDEDHVAKENKSDSISPKIDLRLNRYWRVYVRYRHTDSEFIQSIKTGQWLVGASCQDLFNSGVYLHCNVSKTENDYRDYDSTYISLQRNFGRDLSLTASYAHSSTVYPENQLTSWNVDSTDRISVSGIYRIGKNLNVLLDYERVLGNHDKKNQILMNLRYRW